MSNEWGAFEQMLKTIQEMVESNRHEIQSLKGELTSRKSRREDTTRIEARLAEEERRSQELLDKLTETEAALQQLRNKTAALPILLKPKMHF